MTLLKKILSISIIKNPSKKTQINLITPAGDWTYHPAEVSDFNQTIDALSRLAADNILFFFSYCGYRIITTATAASLMKMCD